MSATPRRTRTEVMDVFRSVLGRVPSADEIQRLTDLLSSSKVESLNESAFGADHVDCKIVFSYRATAR